YYPIPKAVMPAAACLSAHSEDNAVHRMKPTGQHTRIELELDRGLTWDEIVREWPGKVSKAAISEAIAISDLVVKHEPFKGFNVGARRKPARRPAAIAA